MTQYLPLVGGVLIAIISGLAAYLTTRKQSETTESSDLRDEGREMRRELRQEIVRQTTIIVALDAKLDAQNAKLDAMQAIIDILRGQILVLCKEKEALEAADE